MGVGVDRILKKGSQKLYLARIGLETCIGIRNYISLIDLVLSRRVSKRFVEFGRLGGIRGVFDRLR